ncbi:MAG TPA: hypothetical protein VIV60_13805, partial [Polyangiaceae bacterium]
MPIGRDGRIGPEGARPHRRKELCRIMLWWKVVAVLTLPAVFSGCTALGANKATTHKKKPKPVASASASVAASATAPPTTHADGAPGAHPQPEGSAEGDN